MTISSSRSPSSNRTGGCSSIGSSSSSCPGHEVALVVFVSRVGVFVPRPFPFLGRTKRKEKKTPRHFFLSLSFFFRLFLFPTRSTKKAFVERKSNKSREHTKHTKGCAVSIQRRVFFSTPSKARLSGLNKEKIEKNSKKANSFFSLLQNYKTGLLQGSLFLLLSVSLFPRGGKQCESREREEQSKNKTSVRAERSNNKGSRPLSLSSDLISAAAAARKAQKTSSSSSSSLFSQKSITSLSP